MANYTRRTVVRGAAWTVPVIAVAAPVPAFSASFPPIRLTFTSGEKCPGNSNGGNGNRKTYIFQFQADSPPPRRDCACSAIGGSASGTGVSGIADPGVAGSISANTVTVNGEVFTVTRITVIGSTVYIVTESSGNSANASGQGSITYTSGFPQVRQTVTFTYADTPPAQTACGNPNI